MAEGEKKLTPRKPKTIRDQWGNREDGVDAGSTFQQGYHRGSIVAEGGSGKDRWVVRAGDK